MLQQTEIQRLRRELGEVSGEALLRKFRSASRADVKLACALQGWSAGAGEPYEAYLCSRLRPALTELVLAGAAAELSRLEDRITPALAEELLETAIAAHVPDSIVWLLKLKERRFGFSDREWEL